MLGKSIKKYFFFQSSYLSGIEPQLPVGAGSPRLFTYQRRYGRHISKRHDYFLFKKKLPVLLLAVDIEVTG